MDTVTAPPPPPPSPPDAGPGSPRPPRARGRRAWRVAAGIVAVISLLWGLSQAVSVLAHEERTETTEFAADGLAVLDVSVDSGSLTVVRTDADVVRVTARISDGLRPASLRREVEGDRLVLRAGCATFLSTFCDVGFTVEVPARMAVRARLDDGSIRIDGTDGDVDARSSNGSVVVRGSGTGTLRLASDNGRVEGTDLEAATVDASSNNGSVELDFAEAPRSVEATSDNGSVTVAVPDDGTSYAVTTGSDNGSTATAIRTDPDAARTIDARSGNGSVLVTYRAG